jgi:hypothetical protein
MSEFVRDVDGHPEELYKFDPFVHAVTVISEPHRMGHDGFMYHTTVKKTGILNAGVEEFLLKVPAATFPHLNRIRLNVGAGDIDVVLFEGTTVSADGAPVVVQNTNRNSANTPDVTLFDGPTITLAGTAIHSHWIPPTGAGIGMTSDGVSNAVAGEEWVLAPSTNYLIRITNNSGATITAWTELLWYEIGYTDNPNVQLP